MPTRMSLFGGAFALLIAFLFTAPLAAQIPDTAEDARVFVDRVDYRLRSTENGRDRHRLLIHLAPAALRAGDKAAATKYSEEMLRSLGSLAGNFGSDESSSIHMANLILGLIAVEAGDTKKAKEHLFASATFPPGRVLPASPVLISFGPSMELAKRLLAKGEKDVVLEYLDLCASFWEYGATKPDYLPKWRAEINSAGVSKFWYASPRLGTWRFSGL